jgi:gliding motility-associated-like protein
MMRKILFLAGVLLANLAFFSPKMNAATRSHLPRVVADTLSLTIETATFGCTSDSISLRIRASGFTNIQSLRYSLAWKKNRFRYSSAFISTPFETISIDASDAVISGTMGVRIDNTAPRNLPTNTILMVINLRVLDRSFLMDTIAFGDSPTVIKVSNGLALQPFKTKDGIVKFTDNQPPDIVGCTDLVERTQGGLCGAFVNWTAPRASDICDKNPTLTSDKLAGTFFPLGNTKVTYTAKDMAGNTKTCTFTVKVVDAKPPLIENCPADMTLLLKSKTACDTLVSWIPPKIMDNCDGTAITTTQSHASGAKFPLGTTLIKYITTDKSGNTDSCSFKITVIDGLKPTLKCPFSTAEITTAGAIMIGKDSIIASALPIDCKKITILLKDPVVEDNCTGWTLKAEPSAGIQKNVFPVGTHQIKYTVTDASANQAVCIINVKITSSDTLNKVNVVVSPSTVCEGGDKIVFTADSIKNVTYNWVGPNGYSSNKRIASIKNPTLLNVGIYQVSALLPSGCLAKGEKMVGISQRPNIKPTVGVLKCDSGVETMPLTATNLTGNIPITSWSWSGPDGFTSALQNPIIQNVASKANGYYKVTAYTAEGCSFTDSVKVASGTNTRPKLKLSSNSPVCNGSDIRLMSDTILNANYKWTGPSNFTSTNQSSLIPSATLSRNGTYSVFATYGTGNGCQTQVSDIKIDVLDKPKVKNDQVKGELEKTIQSIDVLANDSIVSTKIVVTIANPVNNGTLTNNNDGTFTYKPKSNFIGFDEFAYKVCYDACPTSCAVGVVSIAISDPNNQCRVPDIITPNGDQYNDELMILCIGTAQYPNNELMIFNEWGDVVFTASPYKNDWKGTFNGKALPDGTYFYIFKEDKRNPQIGTKTGAVTIFR